MDNITENIPEYFICPISLQIMKDPVTTTSGITYDRESIERWLFNNTTSTCPVTNQPLAPRDSDLTPNHTLHRLIQAWCSSNGVDRIPTPKPPLTKFDVTNLIKNLSQPDLQIKTLRKLEALATDSERNKVVLREADLANAMLSFIISRYEKRSIDGLQEALNLFLNVRHMSLIENEEIIIEPLLWVLGDDCFSDDVVVKSQAAHLMKAVVHKANPNTLERLRPDFFVTILSNIRPQNYISEKQLISLLHILFHTCPWGRNRAIMIELNVVSDLIEVELKTESGKKTTELVLGILCHLCSCAGGRAQLVSHGAGILAVSKAIMNVSSIADDRAVFIIWSISKFVGTNEVIKELMRAGGVSKLCMVMQADCAAHVKERAKEVLRTHADVWKDFVCSEIDTLTRCVGSYEYD